MIHRLVLKSVLGVVRFPKITLAISMLMVAICIMLGALRLKVSTDQNELFSPDIPFFSDYLYFIREFPENEAIYVVLRADNPKSPPPAEIWSALADDIVARLRKMPESVSNVYARIPTEQLGSQGLLFAPWREVRETHVTVQKDFVRLVRFFGQQDAGLSGVEAFGLKFLGETRTEQFVRGLATQKPTAEMADFVRLMTESWVAALKYPPEQWSIGGEKGARPDLQSLEPMTDPSRKGYQYIRDQAVAGEHLLLINVYQNRDYGSMDGVSASVEAIRAATNEIAAAYPEFKVALTGRPVLEADEIRTADADTRRAEIIALSVVFVALTLTFISWYDLRQARGARAKMRVLWRGIWLTVAAEVSLAAGIAWTFGWATLTVGRLNLLSTVFVLALIGIGMDYFIQILTRYRQEIGRYKRPEAIWARVFRYVHGPIFTACLGASGAFLVSALTHFRGASELGIIAGGGLLLVLLSGYTVLPAILVLLPVTRPEIPHHRRYPSAEKAHKHRRWQTLILPATYVSAAIVAFAVAMPPRFNPDLISLQAQGLESVDLVRHLPTWSAVVLSKDLDALRPIRDKILREAKYVADTDSLLDAEDKQKWLAQNPVADPPVNWYRPGNIAASAGDQWALVVRDLLKTWRAKIKNDSPADLQAAIAKLSAAADEFASQVDQQKKSDRVAIATRLTRWQQDFVDLLKENLGYLAPGPLNAAALPVELRGHYVSADGVYALYINPKEDLWDTQALGRFSEELKQLVPPQKGIVLTGIAPQVNDSTHEIQKAFLLATLYALGLIVLLVLIDLRSITQTLLAVSVLAFGLPVLLLAMKLLGVSWNYANFFGLPILIGAGHEYGVFMIHRYREVLHNPRRVWGVWDVSDRALLTCAFVTSASFGFLAFAGHRGLRSLGLVMCLGCMAIYLATFLVQRPLLRWRLGRKNVYQQEGAENRGEGTGKIISPK